MELYVDLSVVKDTFCQILSGLINYSFYLKCTCSNFITLQVSIFLHLVWEYTLFLFHLVWECMRGCISTTVIPLISLASGNSNVGTRVYDPIPAIEQDELSRPWYEIW